MLHYDENSTILGYPSTVFRRVTGPEADEIFVLCRPERPMTDDLARQVESVCARMRELLRSHGGSVEHLVHETVFFRSIRNDLEVFRKVRRQVLGEDRLSSCRPTTTLIEQPPLNDGARLEISAFAVIPHRPEARSAWNAWDAPPGTHQADCPPFARGVRLGDHAHVYAANIYGADGNAFDEAYSMFCSAEALLRQAGSSFPEVVRTWIYLRDIGRDYADFNRARREFFQQKGIGLPPASTGIAGGPPADGHNFSMSLHAITSPRPLRVVAMSAPTLNEAWTYGADFSRGLRVAEANKIALYISGTASVDEAGHTVHVDNFAAQADRMLTNISTLLAAQGASFRHLVSAVTYLKHPGDAQLLRSMFHDRGFDGFPHALVTAPICRPDLLCETEAIAALPLPPPSKNASDNAANWPDAG